jgi:hypothetical protein
VSFAHACSGDRVAMLDLRILALAAAIVLFEDALELHAYAACTCLGVIGVIGSWMATDLVLGAGAGRRILRPTDHDHGLPPAPPCSCRLCKGVKAARSARKSM